MTEKTEKKASIMIMHDELCQVFNGLMTALSLQRAGARVTVFFGSRGINAVHREKIKELKCLPDQPEEEQKRVMARMEEMNLPMPEELLLMLHMEGARLLACPLNKEVFEFTAGDFVEGVALADPATYYTDIVMPADMNLVF
ncbi:MAG: DsrE/DsrF/DrsH-like family protein [Proteobacteria bacterium]|nr:DsrE/DsrF/DrsH-like family protein [Pseudomonadota bacterium]MBU1714646.1 DsrE/DsrF/DrsH-like family protein [Pseudomonadota bacterium]